MPAPRRIGFDVEDRAAEFLVANGYTLITRRYKTRTGEIDIVALDGEVIAMVEVRQRTHPQFTPEASVDERKKNRIFSATESYLAKYEGPDREVRFDLVAVTKTGITLHKDAFRPYG